MFHSSGFTDWHGKYYKDLIICKFSIQQNKAFIRHVRPGCSMHAQLSKCHGRSTVILSFRASCISIEPLGSLSVIQGKLRCAWCFLFWWMWIHTRRSDRLLGGYSHQGKGATSSSSPGVISTSSLEDSDGKCQAVGVMRRNDISRKLESKNEG